MLIHFSKYQGAGNDFVIIDNRQYTLPDYNPQLYAQWCDRRFGIGADGLILINPSPPEQKQLDFEMRYYNADGHLGSLCGNGSRCAVAFAHHLGIISQKTHFLAADGEHEAIRNSDNTISLKMNDLHHIETYNNDYILNTGSPHYIRFVENLSDIAVNAQGSAIRNAAPFKAEGINVNFVQIGANNTLHIATFERGVEAETLACGTGIVAASIAAHYIGKTNAVNNIVHTNIIAKGGELQTRFTITQNPNTNYTNIWLIGGAEKVFEGTLFAESLN